MRWKRCLLVLLFTTVTACVAFDLFAEQVAGVPDFSIRQLEAQTVLYTIYRGPYEQVGMPIGELFAKAMMKKIIPRGSIALVYLNKPQYTSKEHYLIEIRIPVDGNALQQAGTLGPMTDVKTLKPMEVAVMKKGPGVTDYGAFYDNLYKRIAKEGFQPAENAVEVFSGNMMSGDYSKTTTEIMVPVVKIEQGKN